MPWRDAEIDALFRFKIQFVTFVLFDIGKCSTAEDSDMANVRLSPKLVLVGCLSAWESESILKAYGVTKSMFPVFRGVKARDVE